MTFAKLRVRAMMVALLLSIFAVGGRGVSAQTNAYATAFTTSITYQNIGAGTANINLTIYSSTGTASPVPASTLAQNGAGSFFVGSVSSFGTSFNGSAVISADQPIAATLVQIPAAASVVKNRPLSNGFSSGSATVLIPTVLKSFANYTSKFVIQNTDSVANDFKIEFVTPTGVSYTANPTNVLPNASVYYDAGTIAELGASFNGSVRVTATKNGTTNPGSAVGTALELQTNGAGAYASQAFPSTAAANKVYMASALCNLVIPSGATTSFYAVQNAGTSAASVTVNYVGSANGTAVNVTSPAVSIAAGAKASFNPCGLAPNNFNGSATINSNQPILAIGKVSGAGLYTAFEGATAGSTKVALPYVRWLTPAQGGQQTFVAIQNVGTAAATNVTVKYYNASGALIGTHTIPSIAAGAKSSSNPTLATPSAAGMGVGGGSAVVEGAGASLIVVTRVTSPVGTSTTGEDYNGIPFN
ncbi:CARDB domain-containing protein [Herpetosiphon llansteffanensis]